MPISFLARRPGEMGEAVVSPWASHESSVDFPLPPWCLYFRLPQNRKKGRLKPLLWNEPVQFWVFKPNFHLPIVFMSRKVGWSSQETSENSLVRHLARKTIYLSSNSVPNEIWEIGRILHKGHVSNFFHWQKMLVLMWEECGHVHTDMREVMDIWMCNFNFWNINNPLL